MRGIKERGVFRVCVLGRFVRCRFFVRFWSGCSLLGLVGVCRIWFGCCWVGIRR